MRMELGPSFNGIFTDPGAEHTGVVVVGIQVPQKTFTILWAGEINGLVESAYYLEHAVTYYKATLWCYEGFRLYAHMSGTKTWSSFPEVETIGAMKLIADKFRQSLHIKEQLARDIKIPPYADQQLRKMGVPLSMMPSGHTRDAFRHFLRYWCSELKLPYPEMEGIYGKPARLRSGIES